MPDVAIVNQTVTATPSDYLVPGTQGLRLKAVRAVIDGTGAAGSFLPALQLLDPAGHVMWTAFDKSTPVAAGGSADVSWFHLDQPTTTQAGTVLQAFVSSIFPNPSGPDYAAFGPTGAAQFDYWIGLDLAIDAGVLGNLSTNGCAQLVFQGSPTTFANSYVAFGINEQGPGFNVPQFYLESRNAYSWFGGPTVTSNLWYHIDLHVVYDLGTNQFDPTLFIDGINQGVPTNHPIGGVPPGDKVFYFGTDQFCGAGSPSNEEKTWQRNITIGTTRGGTEIADLTSAAALNTAITNGSGDNPAASLSVLTTLPF